MADDARSRRLTALEEKKRRLEELKARRSTRSVGDPGSGRAASSVGTSTETTTTGGGGLDDYIDGLLASKAPTVAPVTEDEAEGGGGGEGEGGAPGDSAVAVKAEATAAAASVEAGVTSPSQQQQQQPAKKPVETFSIATQTEEDDFPPPSEASSVSEDEEEKAKDKDAVDGGEGRAEEGKGEEDEPVPPLTEEEREAAISSAPFSSFFTTASKRVERLLGAPLLSDLLADANYAGEEDGGGDAAAPGARGGLLASGGRAVFECPRWTAGRTVTDVNWSPAHRELLLGSYHMPSSCSPTSPPAGTDASSSSQETTGPSTATMINRHTASANSALLSPQRVGEERCDGLAVVWNLAMPNRPEHIFSSNSPVLAARFHPTEHHLVVGGCHSGQVVVWDLRSGRLPVQKSTLSIVGGGGGAAGGGEKGGGAGVPPKGHAHPICALEVAEGGSGLVSASTDGRLNFWSLGNLREPAESFFLKGANLSSLAVAPESDSVICGDEAGGLHAVVPQSSSTPTAGGGPARRTVRTFDTTSTADADGGGDGNEDGGGGHFGMVTAVATKHPAHHASANAPSLSLSRGFVRGATGLVLTSGVDWTTKLWAPAYVDRPLLSFTSSSYDYMCDVQWSPTNPSLFASASSNGTVDIWNLASSLDEPLSGSDGISLASVGAGVASDAASPSPTNAPSMPALNKLRWSGDGRRLAVASADRIHVLGVTEEVYRPKGDEEARMMGHLGARGLLDADS